MVLIRQLSKILARKLLLEVVLEATFSVVEVVVATLTGLHLGLIFNSWVHVSYSQFLRKNLFSPALCSYCSHHTVHYLERLVPRNAV